jgi:hypothetical protein
MTSQAATSTTPLADTDRATTSELYRQGIVAGVIGAATVAAWFFVIDLAAGRPLYTPSVLGTAIFRQGEGLQSPETLRISGELVFLFTWVHTLAFAAVGGLASRLLGLAERNPSMGFGLLLLFVFFEFAFVVASMLFAEDVLAALAWPAIAGGNLLAAAAMAAYFWRHHPNLRIEP